MLNKVIQNNVFSMKISNLIKNKLEKLAENEGVNPPGYLRNLINREYSKTFGDTIEK